VPHTLKELAAVVGDCNLAGDGDVHISDVCSLANPQPGCITFALSPKWIKKATNSSVAAIIVKEPCDIAGISQLIHPNPRLAFAIIVEHMYRRPHDFQGISAQAAVDSTASIGDPVSVAAFVSISAESAIAAGTRLDPGVRIAENVTIGRNCYLHANVVIERGCTIGDNVIIHAGTVVGADGFGYVQDQGRNRKVPQIGAVVIGNDVEIGANCCIDRGTIDNTVIGNGVVVDNLAQIAHNVTIGDDAVIVAQVGLAGSATVGARAILGGKAGATEGVVVGDGAILAAQCIATHELKGGAMYAGNPAIPVEVWRKSKVIQRRLPEVWPKLQKILKESE